MIANRIFGRHIKNNEKMQFSCKNYQSLTGEK